MKSLKDEFPRNELSDTLDNVMIDYAIASVLDMQSQSPEEAANNIRKMKKLRDSLRSSTILK